MRKIDVILPLSGPIYTNNKFLVSPMLEECVDFLESRCKQNDFSYEIIIVSDGSTDGTLKVANKWCSKLGVDKLRVLELETNRGKGGAVRLVSQIHFFFSFFIVFFKGMQSARGSVLLFADADGATKFSDFTKLEKCLCDIIGGW